MPPVDLQTFFVEIFSARFMGVVLFVTALLPGVVVFVFCEVSARFEYF